MIGWKCLLLLLPCLAVAQVNTEKIRSDEKQGFSGSVSLGYSMAMGNSEYLSFTPSTRIDYNTEKYINFIAASYNRKQTELKKGKEFLMAHKGFAHIRSARILNEFLSWEVFGQWEFNEFINLERRLLGGSGARFNLLHSISDQSIKLFLGTGGMYEHEVYSVENDKSLWRSTNYVSFKWKFTKQGSVQTTGYYQVSVVKPDDYRVISDNALKLKMAEWLTFGTSVSLRYDNDPAIGVKKKYDLELNNNFTAGF